MRGKKKVLVGLLATLMLSSVAVGMTGCKPDNPDNSSTSEVQGLTGNYYCSAAESDYTLSLDGARFELKLGNQTLSGAYTFEGENLVLLAEAADGVTEIEAKAKNGVITFKYGNESYTFYENVDYTVTFDVNGGTAIAASKVKNGQTLAKPADPAKEGYRFIGWYADKDFKTPFAFDSDVVTSDMTLYARFVAYSSDAAEYTVTLVVDGEEIGTVETINGVAYDLPTPKAEGKTFAGWWVSDSQDAEKLTYKYVDQVLTQDVKLFAVWADGIQASVNASSITWSALATGVEYTVKVEDAEGNVLESRKTTALSLEYDFSAEAAGEYKITVTANGKTATVYYMHKALARVSNFEVQDGNMLVFNAVENAQKYLITVVCGNAAHVHTDYDNGNSTNYNFANCAMPEDGIKFVVKAVADGYVTSVSETYVYNRKLAAVENVMFNAENGDLVWDAVENATSYKVEVTAGGKTTAYNVATNSMSMKAYTGDVSVKVTAVAANYNSEPATEYSYTCNKLVAPVATLVGDELSWNAVAGASSYAVVINGTSYTANGTTFAIPAEYKTKGNALKITVQAVAAEAANSSYASDEMTVNYGVVESVSYADGALTWDLVGGAYSYKVQVNGGVAKDASQGMALSYTKAGDNTVTLSAYNSDGALLSRKDITVKAYEVSFNAQGGAAVGSLYLATGDAIELPTSSKAGYSFQGWYVSAGDNAAKYENVVFEGEEDTTLYAYWESNLYEVTLMVGKLVKNEETGKYYTVYEEYAKEYVPYGKSYSLSAAVPEDKSKAFVGWYEDGSLSSRQFTDKNGNSINNWSRLGGHTLYAGMIDLFSYTVQEDADSKYYEVSATADAKDMAEITIPEYYVDPITMEALPVWGIASGAFENFSLLQTLNIPDTIKYINFSFGGPSADGASIYNCNNLKNINVYCVDGEHGEHADHETFFSSEDGLLLRHASPNTGTLDYGTELAFVPYNRRGVLEIPVGVEHIAQRTLSYMSPSITQVIIPHTVKRVGDSAFRGSYFKSIVFAEAPEGVDEVALEFGGLNIFNNVTGLTELILPTRIGVVDFNAVEMFDYAPTLMNITIAGNPTAEQAETGAYFMDIDGVVVSSDKRELVYMLAFRTGEYTIPVEIETIGERAFYNTQLSKVIIKDNVYEIKKEAFLNTGRWNTSISKVEFVYTKGELEIGEKAFYGCDMLQELVLPAQLTKLGANAFGGTEELQTVTLNSASDAEFAANVFADEYGEGYVTTLNIGATVPTFEINSVFYGCRLYAFNIDAANPNFKKDAQGVLYDANMSSILYYPFGVSAEYVIPASVETIGAGVFENRANITTMNIPATVKTIKAGAFKNCGIETLTFSAREDDLVIESNAFEGCVALESVALPENMTALANNAFKGCSNLTSVSIPSTLTEMSFANVFAECDYLENVEVAAGNTAFKAVNSILYAAVDGVATELLLAPTGYKGAVVVPSTVTTIAASAFKGHRGVTSFSFENNTAPASLTLGASLFENAKKLTTVRLPDGLQQIPSKMLMGSSVTYVYVPNTVSVINNQAFANCEKLTEIEFEEGNDTLALDIKAATNDTTSAFAGTKKLTYIKLPNRTAAISDFMFAGSYLTDVDLPAGITSIGASAFVNSKGLTEFVMPDTITSLGDNAFAGCENLKTVVLSKGLTTIPQYAFGETKIKTGGTVFSPTYTTYPASSIETIVIPASVKKIDNYAFAGCKNLKTVTFEEGSQLTTIGTFVFLNAGLTSFDMPDSVTSVGQSAFTACVDMKSITLSDSLTTISQSMLGGGQVKTGGSALRPTYTTYEASGIESIYIPASVTSIAADAFKECKALKTVTFDEDCQLASIGNLAFEGSGITSITLPHNDTANTTFGTTIFHNCVDLKEAYLPSSIAGLNNCFLGCSLTKFEMASTGDVSQDAYAVDAESGFVFNGDRNMIQLYFGTASEVVIPAGVTDIAANAFAGNTSMTKVTFPSSLVNIGNEAFMGCTNLATVNAPNDIALSSIGSSAFKNSGLTSIIVPNTTGNITVGASAFEGCTNLTTAVLFNMNMANAMFKNCTSLNSVTFMADTVVFNGSTFYGCTGLKSFTWPKTVAGLKTQEFYGSGLTSIDLPAGLPLTTSGTSSGGAGAQMFYQCKDLKSITIDDSYTALPYQILFESGITSLTMPKSLTTIGTNALTGCESLQEVIFPEEIKEITFALSTFARCDLREVDFSGIETINLVWNSSFSYYEGYLFNENPNLTSVKLPASLTMLPQYCFKACPSLVSVDAPGVTEIGKQAFDGCTNLTNLNLNKDITVIDSQAFKDCKSLTSYTVADTVTAIGDNAFYKSGLTSVDLGSGVTSIGKQAFYGTLIEEVTIPAQLETLGDQVFGDCVNLVAFSVENGSNFKIGDYGELYDSFDQLVVFPMAAAPADGMVTLRPGSILGPTHAFYGNTNITEVVLSNATMAIPANTFTNSSIASVVIPMGVASIGDSAFSGCLALTAVELPKSVTSVGSSVFSGCVALADVTLPKNLATIGKSMFQNCTALTNITLPANVTTIDESAFSGSGLTAIEFPAKLTTIKSNAFKNTKLTSVVIPATVTVLGSAASSSSSGLGGVIGVKPGLGGGTTSSTSSTPTGVFEGCTELTSVVFEGIFDTFGKDMFKGCTKLESVTFAEGWDTIEEGMFNGCTALNVEIPATVETIEKDAFAGWTAEQTITINVSLADANNMWGEGWNGEAKVVVKA